MRSLVSPALPHAHAPLSTSRAPLSATVPALLELLLVAVAILSLLPSFDRVARFGDGRDGRFLDHGLVVAGLPEPVLATVCASHGELARETLRRALCPAAWLPGRARTSAATTLDLPPVLSRALEQAALAFAEPLRAARARVAALPRDAEAAPGGAEPLDTAAAIEDEIEPFVRRYRLGADEPPVPEPLRCLLRWAPSSAAHAPAAEAADVAARADAVLLLAAALDGRSATAPLAADAALPRASAGASASCSGIATSLAATADLMADARRADVDARKNDATRALARSAGLQWGLAMALGYAFLAWSRHSRQRGFGIGAALLAWAVAGWLAAVPWPLAGTRAFVLARTGASLLQVPAGFVVALAAAGALVLLGTALAAWRRRDRRPATAVTATQSMSSRVGYAGFVLATGLGALVLLDLSFHGHFGNRYLALYHQGHLWLAMVVLSVVAFLRRDIARALAWPLSVLGEAARRATLRVGRPTAIAAGAAATLAALLAFGFGLAHTAQLTSELGRLWLILGAAWFFFLRAGPLTERLARGGPAALALLSYTWPMLFVVGVLVAAMFMTHDMGPLLISGYAAGAFVAATLATWWHHRSGRVVTAFALAAICFAAWIGVVTVALFHVGNYDTVAASRLESVAAPYASVNDQLALVTWFQHATPIDGFGLGTTPWCGFAPGRSCSGVPAQIHSDYTFTALVGVFGPIAAWAASVGATVWLHRLIRHHGRVTRGEPRLVGRHGRFANDGQALLSWVAVAWVVMTSCQLAVTVAGNLALLPLTGVTFPFVSFGMTSLLVNVAFLALCLNVDVPARKAHG